MGFIHLGNIASFVDALLFITNVLKDTITSNR